MSVRVGTLRINLAVDLQAFQKGLGQAERALNKTANQFNAIGSTLTGAVTAPLAAAGAAAVKLGADFDSSMSKIEGLLGGSAAEVAAYRQAVLGLAGPTAKAPLELAGAMNTVVDAGFKGAEAVDVLRVAAKASTAGLGETARIADAVTVAMKVYKNENLSAAQAASVLIAVGREGRVSLDEMMQPMQSIAPVAAELGVKFNEVGAAIAAMSDMGLSATESGTALRSMFTTLLKPSTDAQKALTDVGLSADGLRSQMREKGLLSVMESLRTAFTGNEEAISRVFPGAKSLSGILTLLGQNGGQAQQVFQSLAATGVGTLDTAFSTAEKTVSVQFNKALAELQVIAIKLSETLSSVVLPGIRALSGVLTQVSAAISSSSQDTKNLALVLTLAAAALGPVALGFGLFFKTLAGGFGILKGAVSLLMTLGGVVTGPILLAAALMATAAVLIINRWQAIADGTRVIVDYIHGLIRDSLVGRVVAALGNMVKWIGEKLAPLGIILWDATAGAFNVVKDEVTSAAGTLYTSVGGAFDGVAAKAGAMATQLLNTLNASVPQINMQTESARMGLEALGNTAQAATAPVMTLWQQLDDSIDAAAQSIGQTYTTLRATMSDQGAAMRNTMNQMAGQSAQSMGAVTASFAKGAIGITQFARQMITEIGKLIAKILLLKALTAVGMGGPFAAGFIGGMFAEGGRPPVGQVSVVGEKGPELFVPDTAGTIVPNDQLGGGSGWGAIEVNQTFHVTGVDLGSDDAARRMMRAMASQMRQGAIEAVTLANATRDQASLNTRRAA